MFIKKATGKQENILILGLGGMGFYLAKRLQHEGYSVTAIEPDSKLVSYADSNLDARFITGSALSIDFIKGGVEQAKVASIADGANKGALPVTGLSYTTLEEFGIKVKSVGSNDPGSEILILVHYHIKPLP